MDASAECECGCTPTPRPERSERDVELERIVYELDKRLRKLEQKL
jgi:hypothetical protein